MSSGHFVKILAPNRNSKSNKNEEIYVKLSLDKIDTILVPADTINKFMKFKVHAMLFHLPTVSGFGNVWESETISVVEKNGSFSLKIDEVLYFYTKVVSSDFCVLLEICKVNSPSGDKISCGWTCISCEIVPQKENKQISQLYYGSARCLVTIGKNYPKGVEAIPSSEISYRIQAHPKLEQLTDLLPDNVFIGTRTVLPGVEKDPGVRDPFASPNLAPTISIFLDKLSITFSSSVNELSEIICKQAVKDLMSETREFEEPGFFQNFVDSIMDNDEEESEVDDIGKVSEWKLKIFAHNGFKVINETQTVILKGQEKSKTLQSADEKLKISDLFEHKGCFIVFQLVAAISLSEELLNKKKEKLAKHKVELKDKSTQKVIHLKQWKFSNLNKEGKIDLQGESLSEIDDIRFVHQSKTRTTLSLNYSKFETSSKDEKDEEGSELNEVDETDYSVPISGHADILNSEPEVPVITSVNAQSSGNQLEEPIHFREEELMKSTPRYRRSEVVSPRDEYEDRRVLNASLGEIKEVPYATLEAPVVALSGLLEKKPLQLSRKSYAEIVSAGFPQIKDDYDNLPSMQSSEQIIKFNKAKEKQDPLTCNEIIIQFLALSKSTTDAKAQQLQNMFFTFQFYKFPPTVTQRMNLTQKSNSASDEAFRPFIFQKQDNKNGISNEVPGAIYRFNLDPSALNSGEMDSVIDYLASQKLVVECWNADSLMSVGSCALDLKFLLRQGRPAVQTTFEYQLTLSDFNEETSSMVGTIGHPGSVIRPTNSQTSTVTGHLHVRLVNVGHSRSISKQLSDSINNKDKSYFWGKTSLIARDTNTGSFAQTKRQASRLPDTDVTLSKMILSEKETLRLSSGTLPEDKERKLLRMKQMRNSILANSQNNLESSKLAKLESLTIQRSHKEEKMKELKLIDEYRSATKEELIHTMLLSDITTDHTLYATFGVTELIEFQFRNPLNEDSFFYIYCDSSELQPITDLKQLKMIKNYKNSTTPINDIFIDANSQDKPKQKDDAVRIFLKGHEIVYIPFMYTSLHADSSTTTLSPVIGSLEDANIVDTQSDSSSLKICIKDKSEKPISILALQVIHQPILVEQTFRFGNAEKTVFKKSVRLPPFAISRNQKVSMGNLSVRCSDVNTICSASKTKNFNDPQDIYIKSSIGPSPSIKKFYISVYEDEFKLVPVQTWLFYIEALKRVDVQCTAGQATRFSVIIKGYGASRLVKVFVSDPAEMEVDPSEPFILSSSNLVEVEVLVKILKPGNKRLYINVVDVDYHQKTHSFLVNATCGLPMITKAFEIKLPIGGGKSSTKKIPLTNNYPIRKRFQIHTDRSDLLSISENEVVLDSGESKMIGLTFMPVGTRGATEVLLYINDDNYNNEDTYCIKVTYL